MYVQLHSSYNIRFKAGRLAGRFPPKNEDGVLFLVSKMGRFPTNDEDKALPFVVLFDTGRFPTKDKGRVTPFVGMVVA